MPKVTPLKKKLLSGKKALGNSRYGFREVCSDLLNQAGKNRIKEIEKGTFLSRHTLDRMMSLSECESGQPYRPNADTCERIMRYFNFEANFTQLETSIKSQFRNKPKDADLVE